MFQGIWVLSVYSCTLVLEVVSGYFHHWHLETVVHQSRLNAVVAFLDSRISQSRQVKLHTTRHTHLAGNCRHLQSIHCSTLGLY